MPAHGRSAARSDSNWSSGGSGKTLLPGHDHDESGIGLGSNSETSELRTEYNLGMRIKRMSGAFSRTRIVTFEPRYMIKNSSEYDLEVAQAGVCGNESILLVNSGEEKPFHWPAAARPKMLQLRIAGVGWRWSGVRLWIAWACDQYYVD